jgi:hypothetical protein
MIRVNDLVADLIVHKLDCPPEKQTQYKSLCRKSQDISLGIKRLEKMKCKFGSGIAIAAKTGV